MTPLPKEALLEVDTERFSVIVAAAFNQRRKTLRNALSKLLSQEAIESVGIDPSARAESLPVEAFVRLANIKVTTPSEP